MAAILPRKFDDGDFVAWLREFDACAAANGWKVTEMKKLLHMRQKLFRLANRNTQRLKKKRLLLCLAQATFAYTS